MVSLTVVLFDLLETDHFKLIVSQANGQVLSDAYPCPTLCFRVSHVNMYMSKVTFKYALFVILYNNNELLYNNPRPGPKVRLFVNIVTINANIVYPGIIILSMYSFSAIKKGTIPLR